MNQLYLIGLIVFVINVPFGYWRANVRWFSLQWLLAIHIPVVFVVALRLASHMGFGWSSYVVLVAAFFLGQQAGSMISKRLRLICVNFTSCLVMDLLRCMRHQTGH